MKKAEARADTVLANGSFEGKEGIATSGSYRIERENGNLQLVLGSDFQTEDGPDLHVVLSPTPSDKATGENVMEETTVTVGALDALEGEQTYDLQDDLALDPLESVAIHCIQFSHLYGVANLN